MAECKGETGFLPGDRYVFKKERRGSSQGEAKHGQETGKG